MQGVNEEIAAVLATGKDNGYNHSMGKATSRASIAKFVTGSNEKHKVTSDDVCITSGCSHALDMAIAVLCNPGSEILIPSPGFSLYRTLANYRGCEFKLYNLIPENQWEADLKHMESLINEKTRAILVNNPSNPCGSNYSESHLRDILKVAEKHRLPIISDEIYAHMAFSGQKFHSLPDLSDNVPILVCGGLAKRYMAPGWRVGWVVACDRNGIFEKGKIRQGLQQLSQTILGANSIAQSIVPHLLEKTPQSYYDYCTKTLEDNAKAFGDEIDKIDGLSIVQPKAAMYAMVGIDLKQFPAFPSDVEFAQALLDQQQVFVLPGSCFTMPNFFRVVLCAPAEKLLEAAKRMAVFCDNNRKK